MMGYTGPDDVRNKPLPPHGFTSYLKLLMRVFQNEWRRYRTRRSGRCPDCDVVLVDVYLSPIHFGKGCPAGHVFYARKFVRPRPPELTVEALIAEAERLRGE